MSKLDNKDEPLIFHESLFGVVDTFRYCITSIAWINCSYHDAKLFFSKSPYIASLQCSIDNKSVKIDNTVFESVINPSITSSSKATFIDLSILLTVTSKEIIWAEEVFQPFLQEEAFQFLRHLRNGCAHRNKFYFDNGEKRKNTIKKLPVSWRGKVINESCESKSVFPDFMAPVDILILLSDITEIVSKSFAK